MIGIVLSMIRARRAQAVTLFLLAMVAVAAAVAGPVSARATDAAVVRLEVAHATQQELSLSLTAFANPTDASAAAQFDALTEVVTLPGFVTTRSGELQVLGPVAKPDDVSGGAPTRMVARDGVCEHVTVLFGRCLAGTREIIIGEGTAAELGLAPGDVATVVAFRYDEDGVVVPDGRPADLTVVGVFAPTDIGEPYWAGQRYFRITADGTRQEPVFTTLATLGVIDHSVGQIFLDALAPPHVLTPERVEALPAEVTNATAPLRNVTSVIVSTDLPTLSERIATSRALARQLGPVAFIPLAGISFFVIYLAVGYGVFGRRTELGLIALRGVDTRRRWLLATGETVAAILLGAPVGYVVGHLGVGLLARARLGSSDGTELTSANVPYAAGALVIALAVALLGQRRAVREPVVDLLREVPRGQSVWQMIAIEALVGALSVVATLQLRTASSEGISGLGLLVPGLLVVAVALVAARFFVPVVGVVARVALRRGFLGSGLSAVQLARRPGSQRLFALLAVGTGMLAFVAAGTDVAARAREDRATVATGAERVLLIEGSDARQVLAATAQLDPDGAWAMAAAVVPPNNPNDPTVLAVDVSRLRSVAAWRPEFGADPVEIAERIGVPSATEGAYQAPFLFRGTEVELDAEMTFGQLGDFVPSGTTLDIELEFATLGDGNRVRGVVHGLPLGRHTVTARVSGCQEGCRFVGFTVPDAQAATQLYLYGIRQLDPVADVVPASALGDRRRWRGSVNSVVVPIADALSVRLQPQGFVNEIRVGVLEAPMPVPVAVAGVDLVPWVTSLDREQVDARIAASLELVPRLGRNGVLVDLRYLEHTLLEAPTREPAEIWLGPAAPADAADQFRALGLSIVGEDAVAERRVAFARQGPALALQFHLAAAVFGVLLALGGLGLVAAVDRRQRAGDLRALRVQGLPRRMARRAALWGYLSIVVLAAGTGLAGAAVAWASAGDRIPIFTDTTSGLTPPRWPQWPAVLQPWAAATLAMVVAAVVASWALRRATRGNGRVGAR